VLSPLDAVAAAKHGAAAVIVSNHGGRALDGCMASIDALPAVVAALRADPTTGESPMFVQLLAVCVVILVMQ
jgi:isopentenyl diphosphate isomerase/L-lactate dehydrogenase-like FMN-dependent dehydrogenase